MGHHISGPQACAAVFQLKQASIDMQGIIHPRKNIVQHRGADFHSEDIYQFKTHKDI